MVVKKLTVLEVKYCESLIVTFIIQQSSDRQNSALDIITQANVKFVSIRCFARLSLLPMPR